MLFRASGLSLGLWLAASIHATAAPVDACKMVEPAVVNAAAKAWFGFPVTLTQSSAPGPRAGTCDFSTDTPKHIDISIFYAPVANAAMYGLGPTAPPNELPVPGLGDRAVFDQDASPANRYKSENLSILKGNAVLVVNLMLDQTLPAVSNEKLADFAKQFVAKM